MPQTMKQVVELAKRAARAESSSKISARHFLLAAVGTDEGRTMAALACRAGNEVQLPEALRAKVQDLGAAPAVEDKIALGDDIKDAFQRLYAAHAGLPPFAEFLPVLLDASGQAQAELFGVKVAVPAGAPAGPGAQGGDLARLVERVATLQNALTRKIIGQRLAVHQIADAMFQAGLFHKESDDTPSAVFLFLGPPGVGKTYSGQLIAQAVCGDDPDAFLHLDMSSYADHDSYRMLVGFEPSYAGARGGKLTEHVAAHTKAVVLFDEIEKAHPVVHNLFMQMLDRGRLEDKFKKEDVKFGQTILIVTTNLGKELYGSADNPGALGQGAVSRPAVLDALRSAEHPLTGRSALAPELCSRLAKGYPILFNHFTPMDLEAIARLAIEELSGELAQRRGVRIVPPDPRLLTLLILRLGPDLDARLLTSGIPLMLMDAYHEAVRLIDDQQTLDRITALELVLPEGAERAFFDELHEGGERFAMIADPVLEPVARERFPGIEWAVYPDAAVAVEALRHHRPDVVLVDLAAGSGGLAPGAGAAKALRRVRAAYPDLPLYLYCDQPLDGAGERASAERVVDSTGARGILEGPLASWPTGETSPVEELRRALARERHLREAFRTRQSVVFDWDIAIVRATDETAAEKQAKILLCPKDIHSQTVVASKDRVARLTFTGIPRERFEDVAGAREAKRRLGEVISWMRHPEALRSLGVDLPTGILLEGSPGNGKTLLARAVAGEASLPFFAASATDFASKWVGESESNVRELFDRAATYAPSILFIDEIDAIGASRSTDRSNVNDAMLNQLLVCMDGFVRRDRPVFFLAATNRADMLDPALKRPGRFDLIITIEDLDVEARLQLLRGKTRAVPLADDVRLEEIAVASMGMSGAQLAQIVKEAAILAFRTMQPGAEDEAVRIGQAHLREALTTVRYGLKREGALPPAEDLRATAVHEAGHALLAELERPGSVHQATILPRGKALGFVEALPEGESHALTARELGSRIRVALAGRSAETLVLGVENASAGCSQDLESATRLAALAVTRFGMSRTIGPLSFAVLEQMLPSSGAAERAAREVEEMVKREEKVVVELLAANRAALEQIANQLMKHETIDGTTIQTLVRSGG